MLWEVERLLDECKELPQVLIMENVPQVIGTKNIEHFAKWQEKLESLGYKNKWQVLNAKDFGIPQNRERCFMVSILGDYYYEFPTTMKLEKRLKDLLETEIEEKYYLSDRMVTWFENHSKECEENGSGFRFSPVENTEVVAKAVTTRAGARMDDNFIKQQEPVALDEQNNYIRKDGCVGTLTTDGSSPKHNNRVIENYRIRKLTPKECWRLMGFDDKDVDNARAIGMSDAQLYKQAGNSIVVNVLEKIFKNLLKNS